MLTRTAEIGQERSVAYCFYPPFKLVAHSMKFPSFLAHITGIASGFGVLAMSKAFLERPTGNPSDWSGIAVDVAVYILLLLLFAGVAGAIHGWLFRGVNAYRLAFSATSPIFLTWLILFAVASPGALGFPVVFLYFFFFALSARKSSSFAR